MFDLTSVDFEKLNEFTVADVMEVNVPVIGESWDLEEVLHLLVDASFYQWLMIINALKASLHAKFLKAVNHMAHELEKHHLVLPKSEEEMKVI